HAAGDGDCECLLFATSATISFAAAGTRSNIDARRCPSAPSAGLEGGVPGPENHSVILSTIGPGSESLRSFCFCSTRRCCLPSCGLVSVASGSLPASAGDRAREALPWEVLARSGGVTRPSLLPRVGEGDLDSIETRRRVPFEDCCSQKRTSDMAPVRDESTKATAGTGSCRSRLRETLGGVVRAALRSFFRRSRLM
ncbi:hypothetical protein DFJ74DRAFT_716869, partial [Hyaloraphidium curvatum]